MKCISAVFVILFVWSLAGASIIQINETMFSTLPQLYALDEWSECQEEGDVYCMVDAALTEDQPSPVLRLLQEYSQQSLKHYNRTVIHRGVCVSRCGDRAGGWDRAAQTCLDHAMRRYSLQAKVLSVGYCQQSARSEPRSAARALAVLCTLLCALAALATVVHVLGTRCGRPDGNKYLLAFSLKRNWEILTLDRSSTRDERTKNLACIEGIRFVGMQCVIFSHVMLVYVYSYIDNPHYIEKMYDQFGWKAVFNSPVWLQAFFSLSGFLTAYTVLINSDKHPLTLAKCLAAVLYRYIRLTPLAVFMLWFTIAWFPLLGSGPQWAWLVGREAADCSERWWYHALYVHNHLPLGKFCMGHTWYLAADMQLHIFGVLLLLVLMQYRRLTAPVLAALVSGSSLAAGLLVYTKNLAPIVTGQSPEVLRTWFAGSEILSQLYLPMWMNLPGYVCGMATAFLLHHIQQEGSVKLHQVKWFNTVFHLSLLGASAVVLTGAVFLSDRAPPRWAAALYAALDRSLLALCFNVFLLGCFTGCTSLFRPFLCWRGFHVLGRLSYSVFLVHFVLLRLTLATGTHLNHASAIAFASLLITSSTLSYLAAIPLCLLVELPAVQLWKAVWGTSRGEEPPSCAPAAPVAPTQPPEDPLKPFDLLSTVRRRLELA